MKTFSQFKSWMVREVKEAKWYLSQETDEMHLVGSHKYIFDIGDEREMNRGELHIALTKAAERGGGVARKVDVVSVLRRHDEACVTELTVPGIRFCSSDCWLEVLRDGNGRVVFVYPKALEPMGYLYGPVSYHIGPEEESAVVVRVDGVARAMFTPVILTELDRERAQELFASLAEEMLPKKKDDAI
jgi:hypothetical protein